MAAEGTQPVKGMSDLGEPEVWLWQRLERQARELFHRYHLTEVRTPVLERADLFVRALGDATDVVQKEMFTLDYQGKLCLALRPEGTAGVIRYLAGQGQEGMRARVYYMGPMFRAERPQAGRRRQFHQIGVEITGEPSPAADAECIAMQMHLLEEWGVRGARVQLNTRGVPEERPAILQGLRAELLPHLEVLCEDCRRRFEQNILRVLDCKREACGEVVATLPRMTAFMGDGARDYFEQVKALLGGLGVEVCEQPRLVRGLDYYAHTVWEITHPALGAQDALSGGGRYRIMHGGRPLEGVGFAMGIERLVAVLLADGAVLSDGPVRPTAWLISLGAAALRENLALAMRLRRAGVACGMETGSRSLKAQLRAAAKAGARLAILRGDDEIGRGVCQLRDMDAASQEEVGIDTLGEHLAARGRDEQA